MNCILAGKARDMSRFEAQCFNWYCDNVTDFTREAGLVGDLVRDLELVGVVKRIFLQAMNRIKSAFSTIEADIARRQMEQARRTH